MARSTTTIHTAVDLEQSLALIEKGQQLAGHFLDAEDMDRARRVLTGELSPTAARTEMYAALARDAAASRGVTHG